MLQSSNSFTAILAVIFTVASSVFYFVFKYQKTRADHAESKLDEARLAGVTKEIKQKIATSSDQELADLGNDFVTKHGSED